MILLKLFLTFFKIGAFTFGGGFAMLPLVQEEVLANGWLTREQIIDFIAVSESTPGPFAINMATFVGQQVGGIPGSIVSTLGIVLPSFLVVLIISKVYEKIKGKTVVKGMMGGLKAAVVGLISVALFSLIRTVFLDHFQVVDITTFLNAVKTPAFLVMAVLTVGMTVLAFQKKIHPIFLIVISAGLGIAAGYLLHL